MKKIEAIITPAIKREYQKILRRLISDPSYKERIGDFLDQTASVTPTNVDVTIDDPDDYKFLQAAQAAQADAIVTNDRHLLDLGQLNDTQICTPQECWHRIEDSDDTSSKWKNFARGLGIGT